MPDLPDIRLPLDITVKEIRGEQLRLTGDTDVLITSLLLQASTQDQHIQLDNFDVKSPQGTLSVQGQATLTGDWPVALTANSALNIEPLKGEKVKLNIGGGLRDELNVALNLSGPVGAQLDVQTRLAEAGLPLALTLQSKQLKWPLSGEAQYQVNDFRLRFNGKATDYALSTRANLKGQDLPPAVLTLDGKGNVEQFKLERLRLAALQGNTDLTALVDWSKAISWTSQLTLSGINTAKQWPEWPAKLDGKITTRGSLHGGSWQLQVPVLQLDGNVKQNKVTARGTLSGNAAGQWKIPGIDLALGRNQLNVKGQLDEKSWNLTPTSTRRVWTARCRPGRHRQRDAEAARQSAGAAAAGGFDRFRLAVAGAAHQPREDRWRRALHGSDPGAVSGTRRTAEAGCAGGQPADPRRQRQREAAPAAVED